jgi:hypothetical protein
VANTDGLRFDSTYHNTAGDDPFHIYRCVSVSL